MPRIQGENTTPALISLRWLRVSTSFQRVLQTGSNDVSIHPRHLSVYLQSCFTRVADMTSRRRLRSSTSHRLEVLPVRLSIVGKRVFPISGATVWNDLPRRICAVTRGFQTTTPGISVFLFLPRHYHMTHVLLQRILPFITTVWTPVVLTLFRPL